MSRKIIQLNKGIIKDELKEMVRGSVEEPLNGLLDQGAQQLTQAAKYELRDGRGTVAVTMSVTSSPRRAA